MTYEHYLKAIPNRPETHFKYVTAETAKIILASHKLRCSSPLLFDDIFDVKRDFDFGFDINEIKEPLANEVVNLLSAGNIPDLSYNPLFEWLIKTLRRKESANTREIILKKIPQLIDEGIQLAMNNSYEELKKRWSDLIPKFRILCLCPTHDNLLMWSHYSDSHKGAVLEFQCIDSLSQWQISQPVAYQDSPPILATKEEWIKHATGQVLLGIDKPEIFYNPYVVTKKTAWMYQEEWRVVDFCRDGETGLFSDYGFDPRELRSVYLGCNMSEKDAIDITSLLKFDLAHVQAFRGKKLERERKLSFERIKS